MTRQYELLYLVSGSHTEEELPAIKENIKTVITKYQGTVTYEDNLGKKRLAYSIDHTRHGYYLLCEFEVAGEMLKQLDRDIKLTPHILRHTLVKRDPKLPRITSLTPISAEGVAPDKPETPRGSDTRRPVMHTPTAPVAAPATPVVPEKVDLEKLDQKLDDILKGDIA